MTSTSATKTVATSTASARDMPFAVVATTVSYHSITSETQSVSERCFSSVSNWRSAPKMKLESQNKITYEGPIACVTLTDGTRLYGPATLPDRIFARKKIK